jgi:hypothetical protein
MPGLRRRHCSARRRYQRGPLKVAQATPWLIDRGDLLAAVQRAVKRPASCNALVSAVPIAPAPAVTTAVRPRAESCAVVRAPHRLSRIVWPWCNGVQVAQRLVIEPHAFGGQVSRRWATEPVPGMSSTLRASRNSHWSATCPGVIWVATGQVRGDHRVQVIRRTGTALGGMAPRRVDESAAEPRVWAPLTARSLA